jgi:hypothetical protein
MNGLPFIQELGIALPKQFFVWGYYEVSRTIRELKLEASRSH